jgi:hypothetical protein
MQDIMTFPECAIVDEDSTGEDPSSSKKRLHKCIDSLTSLISSLDPKRGYTLPEENRIYPDTVIDREEFASSIYRNLPKAIDWKKIALEQLNETYEECLEEDWDGYNANPISREAYLEAINFLEMLPFSLPIPDILPEPDGGIGLEWYKKGNYVFIASVSGNNTINYAGLFGESNEIHGKEYFGDSIPNVIIESIQRLFPRG